MSDHDKNLIEEAKKAVGEINKAFEEFKKVNDDNLKQRDTVLEEKLEKINKDITEANKIAEEAVLAAKRSARVITDENGETVDLDQKAADWAKVIGKETGFTGDFNSEAMTDYKKAFLKLARKNFNTDFLTDVEKKALSVGTDSAGGYFVHPDMSGAIVKKIYETSPVRAYASVTMISTDTLEGYYDNDEVGYGWVSELEARTETTTPTVGKWAIPVHEMYAMPKASQKMLDDSVIDPETWLSAKIADRFTRAENSAFCTGDGTGKPRGFMAYSNSTDLTVGIEQHNTGVNGDFAAAPNAGDVLITALYDLKAVYRANATWFMNSSTQAALRKEKDSDGVYIWQPGIQAGQPATVFGRPVATFEDLATMATGSLSIAVGDLRSAYQIVDRMGIRMLRDPYTTKGSVLFYATKRTGGGLINGEAMKIIKFAS